MRYTVTIQDLRPGANLKRYTRTFEASTKDAAYDLAVSTLRSANLDEGTDYHIASCEPR